MIWLPIYFIFLSLIIDVSVMFHHKAQAIRIVQDGNRAMNTGLWSDEDATAGNIKALLAPISPNATVETMYTGVGDEFIATRVRMPATDLAVVGFFTKMLNSITVEVTAYHLAENCLVDPESGNCIDPGASST